MNSQLNNEAYNRFKSFLNDYELIASYHSDQAVAKKFLGEKNKYCRFCNKSYPDVTFKNDAHAIPQFMGNRFLLSNYECDDCNELFSRTLENEMGNFMKILHTSYGVKGQKKIPTYKRNGVRFETIGTEVNIEGNFTYEYINPQKLSITLPTDEFIPIAIYKCLTKIALSIIPEKEILHLRKVFEWIREDHSINHQLESQELFVIFSKIMSEKLFPNISAVLFKSKKNTYIPKFVFRISYSKFSFQISIPFYELDTPESFMNKNSPYLPHLIDIINGLESSERYFIDLSSNEKSILNINFEINNLENKP